MIPKPLQLLLHVVFVVIVVDAVVGWIVCK